MRVGKGCERCRHRHIRCVIPPGASACTPCARLDHVCHLDPRFQFKTVRHVYQKSNGSATRFDLAWDKEQVWVDLEQPGGYSTTQSILVGSELIFYLSDIRRRNVRWTRKRR